MRCASAGVPRRKAGRSSPAQKRPGMALPRITARVAGSSCARPSACRSASMNASVMAFTGGVVQRDPAPPPPAQPPNAWAARRKARGSVVPQIPRPRSEVRPGACRRTEGPPGHTPGASGDAMRGVGTRRTLLALPAGLLALPPSAGRAQDGASRPITLVVPFPAGSVTDNVTRAVAQHLQEILGQPVVVDNRPGAQGTLAP